ncbi:hypothetical protein N5C66_28195 [Rhizobium pusense]|jgi:hypothetical protein|uniref:hypothetical protein n=1 Tax=Agrobacterium TaxID=357 RepID=UPI001300634B|nr:MULTISPECIES: hypothetical protein [Agrobacterium]MDH0911915.1 hypothetical protein [Agrobacterium pusense]MDH1097987.1 hypothetical protein [Agrobacterium pusense]MDH1115579.1 hypothetical protein [Agrobacterium pusense]MDH2196391.1 hypothetical protein [Agrobacterium pusense]
MIIDFFDAPNQADARAPALSLQRGAVCVFAGSISATIHAEPETSRMLCITKRP